MIKCNCIQLRSGAYFYYHDLSLNGKHNIFLEDIAYSLSNLPRYVGQASPQWTVGQHSLLVERLLDGSDGEMAAYALLHDAAEAYIGDLPGPMLLNPELGALREFKRRVEALVLNRFGLNPTLPAEIKVADMQALAIEKEVVLGAEGRQSVWEALKDTPRHPMHEKMVAWIKHEAYFQPAWDVENELIRKVLQVTDHD